MLVELPPPPLLRHRDDRAGHAPLLVLVGMPLRAPDLVVLLLEIDRRWLWWCLAFIASTRASDRGERFIGSCEL